MEWIDAHIMLYWLANIDCWSTDIKRDESNTRPVLCMEEIACVVGL
jgi:hypothetical protein